MKKKIIPIIAMAFYFAYILVGCASLGSMFQTLKGELVGNSYQIWEYDNFGNRILTLSGDKIALSGDYDSETGELVSSYIDITVDGKSWEHVGGTLVFAQEGADMITDFQIPSDIESTSSLLFLRTLCTIMWNIFTFLFFIVFFFL